MINLKSVWAIVAAICSTGLVQAVSFPFSVNKPDVRMIVSNGVNIRKTPSATAPKLVYNVNDENLDFGADPIDVSFWSAGSAKRNIEAVQFTGPGIVIGEKDDWYQIRGYGAEGQGNGWVNAKYCKPFTPQKLVYPNELSEDESFRFLWLTQFPGTEPGEYAMYYDYSYNDLSLVCFYIGKVVDGMLVCPYSFGTLEAPVLVGPEDNVAVAKVITPDHSLMHYWEIRYNTDYMDSWSLNLSKLPRQIIEQIVENAKPLDKEVVFYLKDGWLLRF